MYPDKLLYKEETILSISKTCLAVAREHESDLANFGIDNDYLDKFETQIKTTDDLFDENKEITDQKILTAVKKEALKEMHQWCSQVYLRIEIAFGVSSNVYYVFPAKDLRKARLSKDRMSLTAEVIIALAEEYAVTLAQAGQTEAVLQTGRGLLLQLRESGAAQNMHKVSKKEATQIRHEKFYDLYKTVVIIQKTARNIFRKHPVIYVMFESPWGRSRGKKVREKFGAG